MMLPMTIMFSLLFTQLTHPLAMGLMLLTQTIMICVMAGMSMKSFWFSYILFLIFLGAMLVLFMYVASLASNETFSFSLPSLTLILFSIPCSLTLILMDPLMINTPIMIQKSSLVQDLFSSTPSILSIIYNNTTMNLTLFIVFYLLLTLIVVVKITNTFFGPLRLSS
uniref:NADH-ubiquinone oxidoreductase chain 6 n=1 Tax=Parapenaeopsis hungerfordi TaxID=290889 RepID=A0A343XYL2_9EUCA|nr:NADH dehydrogenase subunit 6 [Parapenaeopsis hungerfordi]AWK60874.1 NADH dehydrogenase subunit 6 [Parapenaeopsis hungerfordi]